MSNQKKCIFVDTRDCPFNAANILFETCQVCIKAWQTETEIRKRQGRGAQIVADSGKKRLTLPVQKNNNLEQLNLRLKEIDEKLNNDEIEPLEYIRLRREHVNSLITGSLRQ